MLPLLWLNNYCLLPRTVENGQEQVEIEEDGELKSVHVNGEKQSLPGHRAAQETGNSEGAKLLSWGRHWLFVIRLYST